MTTEFINILCMCALVAGFIVGGLWQKWTEYAERRERDRRTIEAIRQIHQSRIEQWRRPTRSAWDEAERNDKRGGQ
jgi:hypothetical protein